MSCGKVAYDKKRSAKRAARRNMQHTGKLYTYRCPECGSWHLTRQARRAIAPIIVGAVLLVTPGCVSFSLGPSGSIDGAGAAEVIRAARGQTPAAPSRVVIETTGDIRATGTVTFSTPEPAPESVSQETRIDNHAPTGHSTRGAR